MPVPTIAVLFPALPPTLRDELLHALTKIESNFREGRWEPSELNGGKLCEVVFTILSGYIAGSYPSRASKPANMVDACHNVEQAPAHVPRSIRIQIPRMVIALYEVRNNRGVGHVGGDVDPNLMDSVCVLQLSKWIVAELVRVYHALSTDDAQAIVDALSQRELSLVWSINGTKRVLNTTLSMKEKMLVLLYGATNGMPEAELLRCLEHSNPAIFRRDILRKAHKDRLIEYDSTAKVAYISPLGVRLVDRSILELGIPNGAN